jgi:4-hydroxybenzoate polyprenyltransferase|tara:strand:- start:7221 stop:7382 length:162 start_codon:yes stop_codon:yes gene_type:complete
MVLGLVIGMVVLFDSSTTRGSEAPPSPWLFLMVSALVVSILLIGYRCGNRKDK